MYIVQFIQAYSCPDINLKPISQSPSNSISLLLSSCLLAHFHAGWELTRPGCMPGRALKPYRAVLLWILLSERSQNFENAPTEVKAQEVEKFQLSSK